MSTDDKNTKLPVKIRVLVGLFAIPSLVLAYMVAYLALNGDYAKIDYFEWIYSLIGLVATYIAVTGKRLF